MTYFGFLLRFLGIPILLLGLLAWQHQRRGRHFPSNFRSWPFWAAVLLHVALAVVYTTPWDNYLVATGVWYYDPALVTGIVLGWVPIEEYTFFVVQSIMTGLWIALLLRYLPLDGPPRRLGHIWRIAPMLALGVLWVISLAVLLSGWQPGTYLGLLLVWALPPIMLQIGFGGDILRRYALLTVLAVGVPTLYLSLADYLAIGSGTWEINPAKSLHWLVGGVLPVEEIIFFLITNTLLAFGMVLVLARESHTRFAELRQRLRASK
ncbi:MAG: lycopene cyclase domain-containing protein [Caldilineales bacterium]